MSRGKTLAASVITARRPGPAGLFIGLLSAPELGLPAEVIAQFFATRFNADSGKVQSIE